MGYIQTTTSSGLYNNQVTQYRIYDDDGILKSITNDPNKAQQMLEDQNKLDEKKRKQQEEEIEKQKQQNQQEQSNNSGGQSAEDSLSAGPKQEEKPQEEDKVAPEYVKEEDNQKDEHAKTHTDEDGSINHGKNWYEGKKSTTMSFSEKYSKPTYIAEIRYKDSDAIWLRMTDFESSGDAQKWINNIKSRSNELLGKVKRFKAMPPGSLIIEVPLGKTYSDYFKDKVIEMPALYSLYHQEDDDYSKNIEHTNKDFKGSQVTNSSADHKANPASIQNKKGLGNFEDENGSGPNEQKIEAPKQKQEEGIIP